MNKLLIAFCIVLSTNVGVAQASGDPAAGKEKAATCQGCHGPGGRSTVPSYPKLAGQHAGYIVKQLQAFKQGKTRKSPVMSPMAAPLTQQDMEDLAAYYASQEIDVGTARKDLVLIGQQLYRGGNKKTSVTACSACHGPRGNGNPAANFPVLSGQHPAYTIAQLKAFKAGERSTDTGQMMRSIAARMTDREIEAVAEYTAGLH